MRRLCDWARTAGACAFFFHLLAMQTVSAGDPDAAEDIRRWLSRTDSAATSATTAIDRLSPDREVDPWLKFIEVSRGADVRDRENALRKLLKARIPDSLRRIILLEIKSDPFHQSREAQFIRRYGFYANWFNRIAYTTSRALQGNLQAFGQLAVDGVFDFAKRGKATPAERRTLKLLRDLEREGEATHLDREKITRLQDKLDLALAEGDLERSSWELRQGNPDLARLYAQSALTRRPAWDKATKRRDEAEREIARRRRAAVASKQVGFPDRNPPIRPNPPELLRRVAAGPDGTITGSLFSLPPPITEGSEASGASSPEGSSMVAGLGPTSPDAETFLAWLACGAMRMEGDDVAEVRQIASRLPMKAAEEPQLQWVLATLADPGFNPELRLAESEADGRASLARFVFVGPRSKSERAYMVTSQFAQAWNALSSIGVFYIFEVAYRSGVAVFSPPPPAEEIFDAQAAFLKAAPKNPQSAAIAERLGDQSLKAGRLEAAGAIWERFGLLDDKRKTRLATEQARTALARAMGLLEGDPGREQLLRQATRLAPGTRTSKLAEKQLARRSPEERVKFEASWRGLAGWLKAPLPSGLPGLDAWFDGNPANGEAEGDLFSIEAQSPTADLITVSYAIRESGRRQAITQQISLNERPPELARWVRLRFQEQLKNTRELERLGRLPIGYEITGGAGLGGVDFYPKLLQVESRAGETRLYED